MGYGKLLKLHVIEIHVNKLMLIEELVNAQSKDKSKIQNAKGNTS